MASIRVGLVADPAAPTDIARTMTDLCPADGSRGWDITVVSEPFTTGSEDIAIAVDRLRDQAQQHSWDLVVGLTELPLHDNEGRHMLVETEPEQRTAVLSLPALGGFRMRARARRAVRSLVSGMADPVTAGKQRVALPRRRGRWRLYNASTLLTLVIGVLICYGALYVVNLAWAFFVLDPGVMGRYLHMSVSQGDLFVLAWFVASAATVGGGLGSGLETDKAIRAAAYSKREQDRRDRLAPDGDADRPAP